MKQHVERLAALVASVDALTTPRTGEWMAGQTGCMHAAAEIQAEARRLEAVAVRHALSMGLGWVEVGDALGITRQAAQQRFGRQGLAPKGWR